MTTNEIEWKNCWKKPVKVQFKEITETAEIETREGKLYGYAGKDVLLKGIRGEVYPCKIDIFKDTYTTTEPKSEEAIRAETAKQIFDRLEPYVFISEQTYLPKKGSSKLYPVVGFVCLALKPSEYEALKKELI